jgi:hypothetical protein
MFLTYKKSINVKKSNNKIFRMSRAAAAAVDKIFLRAYSLDHKT